MLSTKKRHERCRHRQFGMPSKVFTGRQTSRVGEVPGLHSDASREEDDAQRRRRRRHRHRSCRTFVRIARHQTTQPRAADSPRLPHSRSSSTLSSSPNREIHHSRSRRTGRRAGSRAARIGPHHWTSSRSAPTHGDEATSCRREKTAAARAAQIGPAWPRSGPPPGACQGGRRLSSTTPAGPPHRQAASSLHRRLRQLAAARREHHLCAAPPKHPSPREEKVRGGAPPSLPPLAAGRRHRRRRRRRQRQGWARIWGF
jgi:hypothetical protein